MKNSTLMVVFKKELLDIFRDKKTLIMSILIPLIMFPLISFLMGKVMTESTDKVENNMQIVVQDQGNSKLGEFLKSQKGIKIMESEDIETDLKEGKILASINIPEGFEENIAKEVPVKVTVTYDNSSQEAMMANTKLNSYIEAYSKQVIGMRLSARNIDTNILTPVEIENKTIAKEESGQALAMLTMFLPLLLVAYSFAGTIGPSVDLGAGEKERGTLEPLLTTQANRMSLLWGKFLAITVMGIIMSIVSIIGVLITMQQENGMFGGMSAADLNFSAPTIMMMVLLPILTTMVFGALGLAISIYARSFKEAQTYLAPLNIIAMVLMYAVFMKDPKSIQTIYFNIPISNVVCLLKELLVGIHDYTHIALTFGWMFVYILISIFFARYMFNREDVIFRT